MRARLWLAALLVVGVAASGLAPRSAPVVALPVTQQAPDARGIAIVRRGYDILLDQYYAPLAPASLLASGWGYLIEVAQPEGLPVPAPLAPLPTERTAAFAAFRAQYEAYIARLPTDAKVDDIAFIITEGMVTSVKEGHTFFLYPDDYDRILSSLGGGDLPIGLGVQLSQGPPWQVRRVAPNGPAAVGGVQVGDVIVAVNGRNVAEAAPEPFRVAIGGPEGTRLTFTLMRGTVRVEATVVRGPFYFPPLDSRVLAGGIGYIALDSFVVAGAPLPDTTEVLTDFDRRLDELERAGARGLVLDLRGNGGGLTFTAAEILGRFLPDDTVVLIQEDTRGRRSVEVAGGGLRRTQLPMAVLVDDGSASSSEVVASALREHNRAVIVGTRTAGVLATALIQPLPQGAGMSVAVAEVFTGLNRFKIDVVGFPVDVEVPPATEADQRAGRDPQLEAAVQALASAPTPPAFRSLAGPLAPDAVRRALDRFMPEAGSIPTTDRLTSVQRLSERQFTYAGQWVNYVGPPRDPLALRDTIKERGWIASQVQEYGAALLKPPGVSVIADLYATEDGARQAVTTNDVPDLQLAAEPSVRLGSDTRAYRGQWMASGAYILIWQRGTVVFTVVEYDDPGQESPELVAAIARQVNDLYDRTLLKQ